MKQVKCDKCGAIGDNIKKLFARPADWLRIRYTLDLNIGIEYDICPPCGALLGLTTDKPQFTTGEQLLELIEEVARNAVANEGQTNVAPT